MSAAEGARTHGFSSGGMGLVFEQIMGLVWGLRIQAHAILFYITMSQSLLSLNRINYTVCFITWHYCLQLLHCILEFRWHYFVCAFVGITYFIHIIIALIVTVFFAPAGSSANCGSSQPEAPLAWRAWPHVGWQPCPICQQLREFPKWLAPGTWISLLFALHCMVAWSLWRDPINKFCYFRSSTSMCARAGAHAGPYKHACLKCLFRCWKHALLNRTAGGCILHVA